MLSSLIRSRNRRQNSNAKKRSFEISSPEYLSAIAQGVMTMITEGAAEAVVVVVVVVVVVDAVVDANNANSGNNKSKMMRST